MHYELRTFKCCSLRRMCYITTLIKRPENDFQITDDRRKSNFVHRIHNIIDQNYHDTGINKEYS